MIRFDAVLATRFVLVLAALAVGACSCNPEAEAPLSKPIALGAPQRLAEPTRVLDASDVGLTEELIPITDRLTAVGPLELLDDSDGLLVGATGQAGGRFDALTGPVDLTRLQSLRFQYSGTSGGRLRLQWKRHGESEFSRSVGWVEAVGENEWQQIELPFGAPWRNVGRLESVAILVPAGEVGTVAIREVELVLRPDQPIAVELDGQLRSAFMPGVGNALEWDVELDSVDRVEFDYGIHPDAGFASRDGVWFEARVHAGADDELVWSHWVASGSNPDHQTWLHASVDLSRWMGRAITLRIATRPAPPPHGVFGEVEADSHDAPIIGVPKLRGSDAPAKNVLLIVIDTLRADALGIYGSARPTSPEIDAFAKESAVFDHAYASGSWTHPSTAALLSGWTAGRHGLGMGMMGTTQLHPDTPLIAAAFQDAGYATAAVSNNAIVSADEGFSRGFDSFDQRPFINDQLYGAQRVTTGALEWIEDHGDEPFFLYLHYFDPHDRYQAPPPYTRMFVDPSLERAVSGTGVPSGRVNPFFTALLNPEDTLRPKPADLEYLRALYDGEVAYTDFWIGRLLDALRSRGLLDSTLVILTSDHGEEFFEHGLFKHGHSLYDEQIHVPLIMRPAGGMGHTRIETPASLLDLAPTLRTYAGLPAEERFDVESRDLLELLDVSSSAARTLVAENISQATGDWAGRQRVSIEWPLKLLESKDGDALELFDLLADPGELENLFEREPEAATRLLSALDSLLSASSNETQNDVPVDPALLEKLKAMGYVH